MLSHAMRAATRGSFAAEPVSGRRSAAVRHDAGDVDVAFLRTTTSEWTMTRNFCIAAALVMGVASTSVDAISLNHRGLGQTLVYPYYTVEKDQDTLISVGNASDVGKVAKVVVLEGRNGRPALYFNLFLAPNDIWTARLSHVAGEVAPRIFTQDASCTLPPTVQNAEGVPLRSAAYAEPSAPLFPADGGPAGLERTREGMLMVVAMGDVVAGSPLALAIEHDAAGVPVCGAAVAIGSFSVDDLDPPGNDLYGSGVVVNVGEGTFFGYNADALADVTDVAIDRLDTPNQLPPLFDVVHSAGLAPGRATANVTRNDGATVALEYPGAMAASAVYMAESILNTYLVAPGLGANTDWIVTFPTRAHHVDALYTATVIGPFVDPAVAGQSTVTVDAWVRDEAQGSAATPVELQLANQVNVISVRALTAPGTPSGVVGSSLAVDVAPRGDAGWMRLDLAGGDDGHALPAATDATVVQGLPAAGFMVYNIINANAAPGRLANYGGAFAHRTRYAESTD
jgi:hypothetical protein